jgi:hypothetical protein
MVTCPKSELIAPSRWAEETVLLPLAKFILTFRGPVEDWRVIQGHTEQKISHQINQDFNSLRSKNKLTKKLSFFP